MQLSQLEKAVLTSEICPARSLRSSAGRKLATNMSKNPLRKLLSIATSTAGIMPVFPLSFLETKSAQGLEYCRNVELKMIPNRINRC